MSIFRSTNPLDFNAVDGIVIDETSAPPQIQGVDTGIAIIVGQFERGPSALTEVTSVGMLQATYGKNAAYSGYQALRNKKYSRLKVIRAAASAAAKATHSFLATATPIISFTAKYKGLYGNSITVAISSGTSSGKKYVVTDTTAGAVLPQETYDNIAVASVTVATFAASKLVDAAVIATSAEPDNIAATALGSGTDGSIADGDYTASIDLAAVEGAGNILFLDAYTAARKAYVKTHVTATQDKVGILGADVAQSVANVVADVPTYRDTDGRLIYTYPWIHTTLDGVDTLQSPASWYASVLSQSSPNIDPASADNIGFLLNASAIELGLSRNDYISLKQAGISAFEIDSDLGGVKIKSGIVTQLADSTKVLVSRRRMADYLTVSIGKFLKLYQNKVNNRTNRNAIKGAMLNFIRQNEDLGILPRDSEVKSGKAKLVDTESLNTDDSIAAGFLYIIYRQRIFSSARYIVLQAEIGTGVVVTEQS